MARNIDDLRLLWSVLQRTRREARARGRRAHRGVGRRAGLALAGEVREAVARAADALSRRGMKVFRAKPPIPGEELIDTYRTILTGVLNADLPQDVYSSALARRMEDERLVREGGNGAEAALYRLRATASYREIVSGAGPAPEAEGHACSVLRRNRRRDRDADLAGHRLPAYA